MEEIMELLTAIHQMDESQPRKHNGHKRSKK